MRDLGLNTSADEFNSLNQSCSMSSEHIQSENSAIESSEFINGELTIAFKDKTTVSYSLNGDNNLTYINHATYKCLTYNYDSLTDSRLNDLPQDLKSKLPLIVERVKDTIKKLKSSQHNKGLDV